jgi:predicted GNAT family N-acyltransferase
MKITIRQATPIDAPSISRLIIDSITQFVIHDYSDQAKSLLIESMSIENIAKNIVQSIDYRVAERNKELVGVLAVKSSNHIFHLFVDDRFHRKRIAQRLWRNWLSLSEIETATVNSSEYGIPFYQSLGFTREGPVYEKDGVVCYPMVFKPLPNEIDD